MKKEPKTRKMNTFADGYLTVHFSMAIYTFMSKAAN